jgi:hypothetical protein
MPAAEPHIYPCALSLGWNLAPGFPEGSRVRRKIPAVPFDPGPFAGMGVARGMTARIGRIVMERRPGPSLVVFGVTGTPALESAGPLPFPTAAPPFALMFISQVPQFGDRTIPGGIQHFSVGYGDKRLYGPFGTELLHQLPPQTGKGHGTDRCDRDNI